MTWASLLINDHLVEDNILKNYTEIENDLAKIKTKPRYVIVTDFKKFLAKDTKTQESLDIDFRELPIYYSFFLAWNAIRMAFLWYTQELGYKAGSEITKDMSGGILQDITKGASILGMFILAVLVERWVSIKFVFNVSSVKLDDKAYIHWDKLSSGYKGIQEAFAQVGQGLSQTPEKVTTFQQNLDSLIPGLMGLLLTFACMWLLKKKVSPITIIIALFVVGVLAHVAGLM